MNDFIHVLETEFANNSNAKIAVEQKAYLRDKFEFFGLKTTERRLIQKPFLVKSYLPPKNELEQLIKVLWAKPQREFQYFGQELAFKYLKFLKKEDIALFEFMATHKSWWDTVDFIASKLMGAYFKMHTEQREPYIEKWLQSENIWLQRCSLLFQLKYKDALDAGLLSSTIRSLCDTDEFFVNKAIGWILREYSRTNPEWVKEFANTTELSTLSRREALRLIQ